MTRTMKSSADGRRKVEEMRNQGIEAYANWDLDKSDAAFENAVRVLPDDEIRPSIWRRPWHGGATLIGHYRRWQSLCVWNRIQRWNNALNSYSPAGWILTSKCSLTR